MEYKLIELKRIVIPMIFLWSLTGQVNSEGSVFCFFSEKKKTIYIYFLTSYFVFFFNPKKKKINHVKIKVE